MRGVFDEPNSFKASKRFSDGHRADIERLSELLDRQAAPRSEFAGHDRPTHVIEHALSERPVAAVSAVEAKRRHPILC